MRIVRFKSTLRELKGCLHPDNKFSVIMLELLLPDDIEEDSVVEYIESLTGFFVLDYKIIEKEIFDLE